jgi:hypothetical protein
MIKSFAEWLQEGAANKQWRTENNRVKEFDRFIELPDAKEIFQSLYQGKPGRRSPEQETIYNKLKAINTRSDLIRREAIRFKGDFDRFAKALQDPLFVLAGNTRRVADKDPFRYENIETWDNWLDKEQIFSQISDSDRIPLDFFKRALTVITHPSVGYTDEEKIISFFNQPLQKQMIDIKSFEKGISPEDKNLANKGYRNYAPPNRSVGHKNMFGVGGNAARGFLPEPEPESNRFLKQQQDKDVFGKDWDKNIDKWGRS